ncbi:uncharacterized protein [Drosophila pseudoobscura]|uniref:Uncharacterized protein n=1 Tax=Drosophila pseudoobscura pseudoobscura TaxID=46245 RepID=A0A6I8VGJ6_DROPS|nr:uncharacterized protein LOC26533671 [Drosophila pseudoobscura]
MNNIIFSQRNSFGQLLPNTTDCSNVPLPMSGKNIRSRITFNGFLGESVGVNDTGDSEKPRKTRPEWNGERCFVELNRLSQFTNIRAVWTPDAKVLHNHTAQLPKLFPHLHSQSGGCGTQYSRRLLVPQASDDAGGQGELRRVPGLCA